MIAEILSDALICYNDVQHTDARNSHSEYSICLNQYTNILLYGNSCTSQHIAAIQ
jgi:hypothetical protein